MGLKQRFSTYCAQDLGITINAFERACDLPVGTIAKCKDSITTRNLAKILKRYPDLDVLWLLEVTDQRNVKETSYECLTSIKPSDTGEIAYLKGQLQAKDDIIAMLTDKLSKKI